MDDLQHEPPQMAEDKVEEASPLTHDSMITVRLSEPPTLKVVTDPLATGEVMSTDSLTRDSTSETPDLKFENIDEKHSTGDLNMDTEQDGREERSRRGSEESETTEEVNWEQLEKTEDEQPRDQDSEDVSCHCLNMSFPILILAVYCVIVSPPGAGEQSSRHESQVWPHESHRKRYPINKTTSSAAVNAPAQEDGHRTYSLSFTILASSSTAYD